MMLSMYSRNLTGSSSQCRIAQWTWVAIGSVLSMSCSLHVHPSDFFVPADMLFMDFFRDFTACQRSFWFVVSLVSLTNLFMLRFRSCECTLIETSCSARWSYIFTVPNFSCRWDTGSWAFVTWTQSITLWEFSPIATTEVSFAFLRHPCLASVTIFIPSNSS